MMPNQQKGLPEGEQSNASADADGPNETMNRDDSKKHIPFQLDDNAPYRRLIAATLLRAIADACHGDDEALHWLYGEEAHLWAEAIDLPAWPPDIETLKSKRFSLPEDN